MGGACVGDVGETVGTLLGAFYGAALTVAQFRVDMPRGWPYYRDIS